MDSGNKKNAKNSNEKKSYTLINQHLQHRFEDESLLDKNATTKSMSRHRQIEQLMKDFVNKNSDEKDKKSKRRSGESLIYSSNIIKNQNLNKQTLLSQQQLLDQQQQSTFGFSITNSSSLPEYQSQTNSQQFFLNGNKNKFAKNNVQLPVIQKYKQEISSKGESYSKSKYRQFNNRSQVKEGDMGDNSFTATGKLMFEYLNSNKNSKILLNSSFNQNGINLQKQNPYEQKDSILQDNQGQNEDSKSVLVSSIDHENHVNTYLETAASLNLDLSKIQNAYKTTSRQAQSKRLQQRSQSQLTSLHQKISKPASSTLQLKPYNHLLDRGSQIKRGLVDNLINEKLQLLSSAQQITEDTQENIDSKHQFFETFHPAKKNNSPSSYINKSNGKMQSILVQIQKPFQNIKTQEYNMTQQLGKIDSITYNQGSKVEVKISDQQRSNLAFKKMSFSIKPQVQENTTSRHNGKLISTDYVPGPGQYNISGTFKSQNTERSILPGAQHKRFMSQLYQNDLQSTLNQSTSRGLSQHNSSIDYARSIYSTSKGAYQNSSTMMTYSNPNSSTIGGGDGNFGLSYENMKKQYFKEYDVELLGKHSPGPGAYSPTRKDFKDEIYDQKTMPQEKRVCPIVPKQQQELQTSPFSYNNQISSFKVHKNLNKYFGTKAERIVDARLFGQQHMYIVKKGLY